MKFPLPRPLFPPLHLTPEDAATLESVARFFVHETMVQYHEHRVTNGGVVDPKRWKKLRHRDDVHVYRDRTHMPSANSMAGMRPSTVSTSSIDFSDDSAASAPAANAFKEEQQKRVPDMPVLLTVGTIEGTLDDVLYGFSSPTPEAMQIKTAYVGDGFVDWMLLTSLLKPSPENPFRELSVRWNIKGHPFLVGAVMRVRDNVYLESIGFTETPEGERIGYTIQHSVELPEIRELEEEMHIIRGKVSFCHLFCQKDDNVVELYVRGFVSAMGDAPPSLVAISAAEFMVSIWKNMHCAHMKKLAWMVRNSVGYSILGDQERSPMMVQQQSCAICLKPLRSGGFSRRISMSSASTAAAKHCQVCCQRVCSQCRMTHSIYFTSPHAHGRVVREKLTFCTVCLQRARELDAKVVAVAEMEEAEHDFPRLYSSRTWTSSSLSMIPSEVSFSVSES
ncbi:hypothetical protein FI667_g8317, partial [Globisporangium splendens]